MNHDEFLRRVLDRTDLETQAEAEAATLAVLETLGDYLSGGEGKDLVAQLPEGIAESLARRPPDRAVILSAPDFLQQVAEREPASYEEAWDHTRAVLEVLQEAVSGGALDAVRRQFPSEFDTLFEA
jgi:uncharacterized protein (DUF2267 family)